MVSSDVWTIGWSRRNVALSVLLSMEDYLRERGLRIAQLREHQGLTQDELADLVGVKEKTISRWENGRGEMYGRNLRKLSEALKADVDEIRGSPPDPLGLGAPNGQVDEILSLLRQNDERLQRIEEMLARRELEDVAAQLEDEPPATAAG